MLFFIINLFFFGEGLSGRFLNIALQVVNESSRKWQENKRALQLISITNKQNLIRVRKKMNESKLVIIAEASELVRTPLDIKPKCSLITRLSYCDYYFVQVKRTLSSFSFFF